MPGLFTTAEMINTLTAIFERHKNERICVIGTMCCGKTTLMQQLFQYKCVDIDDVLWPQISEAETEALSKTPITEEIMDSIYKLAYEKVIVTPGCPLFGFVILDCEAVIYLDISQELLKKHCDKRGDTGFTDASYIKKRIEEDWAAHKIINEKVFYYLTVPE